MARYPKMTAKAYIKIDGEDVIIVNMGDILAVVE